MKTLPTLFLSIHLVGCSYNGTCDVIDRGVNNLIERHQALRAKMSENDRKEDELIHSL